MAKQIKVPLLVGAKIVAVRPMMGKEAEQEGFDYGAPLVLVLDNGLTIYALQDNEGNGPGVLAGRTRKGQSFYLAPEMKTKMGIEVAL